MTQSLCEYGVSKILAVLLFFLQEIEVVSARRKRVQESHSVERVDEFEDFGKWSVKCVNSLLDPRLSRKDWRRWCGRINI